MLKCRNGAGVLFMVEMALSNIYIYRERESERERNGWVDRRYGY
jgi:hypothetical protein